MAMQPPDLNPDDWLRATDAEPFAARNRVFEVLEPWFDQLGAQINNDPTVHRWAKWLAVDPKQQVVRGNNLHGLPYLFLDAPQWILPNKRYTLIRLFCWWGKEMRLSFQSDDPALVSRWKYLVQEADSLESMFVVKDNMPQLDLADSPWQWHRDKQTEGIPLAARTEPHVAQRIADTDFVKFDYRWPFGENPTEMISWEDRLRALIMCIDNHLTTAWQEE